MNNTAQPESDLSSPRFAVSDGASSAVTARAAPPYPRIKEYCRVIVARPSAPAAGAWPSHAGAPIVEAVVDTAVKAASAPSKWSRSTGRSRQKYRLQDGEVPAARSIRELYDLGSAMGGAIVHPPGPMFGQVLADRAAPDHEHVDVDVLMQVVRRVGGTWHDHRLILFGFLSQSPEDEGDGRGLQCGVRVITADMAGSARASERVAN